MKSNIVRPPSVRSELSGPSCAAPRAPPRTHDGPEGSGSRPADGKMRAAGAGMVRPSPATQAVFTEPRYSYRSARTNVRPGSRKPSDVNLADSGEEPPSRRVRARSSIGLDVASPILRHF